MSQNKLPKIQCRCACGRRHHNSVPCYSQTFEIPLSPLVLSGLQDLIVQVYLVESEMEQLPAVMGEQCDVEAYQPPDPVCTSQFSAITLKQRKVTIYNGINDNDGNFNATSAIQWIPVAVPAASVERYSLHVQTLPPQIDIAKPAELSVQFWRTCQGGKTNYQKLSRHCAEIVELTTL